jgi:hypothetical protein
VCVVILSTQAAKIGIELLEAPIPDPLDALELLVDFAGSYAQAQEAIRERNRVNGFAIGGPSGTTSGR